VGGPFPLAEDFVDAVIIDDERVAVSHLKGLEILNAKTGRGRSLINDAPQAQRLARVGDPLYVSSPKRLYVVDLKNERVLKSLDMGGPIEAFHRGGSGWRMLVSVPSTRSVAVIATDYHAEISRFFFGDDPVGPVAIDDSGKRALTTTGRVPISGLEPPAIATRYGAMYAFDPSRLSSQQDRVRSAMTDNAVDILMVPDGTTSYLLLRKTSELVVQKRQPSSTVRQIKRVKTCKQPEGLQLVRRTRRAVVRCNLGRAIDIIDLDTHRHIKRISLGVRVSDLAVSPDGTQAIAALPQDTKGAVAVIDLSSFQVRLHELSSDPQRVRLTPDGRAALILSDRTKKAWVLR
jgi:DNA-binding beta-propeller fold protein YncE